MSALMEVPCPSGHRATFVASILLLMLGQANAGPNEGSTDPPEYQTESQTTLSRQKRFLWLTNDGELTLPAGSCFEVVPTLTLPLWVSPDKDHAICVNFSLSLPFDINFDSLGITSEENPFGSWHLNILKFDKDEPTTTTTSPDEVTIPAGYQVYSTRWGRNMLVQGESKREARGLDLKPTHVYGGERLVLYKVAESLLSRFHLDGTTCLLRAICEIQAHRKLDRYGLIGEALKLFLTPSRSLYAIFLVNYLQAENRGKKHKNCFPYFRDCPASLFGTSVLEEKYREIQKEKYHHRRKIVPDENEEKYM